jgi:NADH-ubiquinone oxidoreductase chain 2
LGLTQYRIKRLFAYSTISHVGFILLALSINSIESIQAFYFYIIQYSLANLNAFMILIGIGYSFLLLTNKNTNVEENSIEKSLSTHNYVFKPNNSLQNANLINSYSPIQFISQLKGFFFINPVLAISFAITIFSFIGVPPLVGFFAKQMILSAALDNGYIFMSLVAILTSVIGAVYYLAIIKELFFEKSEYNPSLNSSLEKGNSQSHSVYLTSSLTVTISILTLFIISFMFISKEFMYLTSILSLS